MAQKKDKEELLKTLLHDSNKCDEISTMLLNSVFTKTVVEKNKLFVIFYDLVAQKFDNDESKIYHYLKKNFDPELIQNIIDAKYPGCLDGCKNRLESLAGRKFIEKLSNKINRSEKTKVMIATVSTTMLMELKFVDLFKGGLQ